MRNAVQRLKGPLSMDALRGYEPRAQEAALCIRSLTQSINIYPGLCWMLSKQGSVRA